MTLESCWDVIVIGGGITGAGVFRESVRYGYDTLLLEKRDFAWGTSSRSSKLVHGGLRYLKEGKLRLVRECVSEREGLLEQAPGLVEPVTFLVPSYDTLSPNPWLLGAGLKVYDSLARKWQHSWLDKHDLALAAPHLRRQGSRGGASFVDAQVDDARLVLRLIFEGQQAGGKALNYTPVRSLEKTSEHRWKVAIDGRDLEARCVVNATGAWASQLHPLEMRPLRGSHLIFPSWRLPCPCAISFSHPEDGRPIFTIPWEGVTICGTTDLDHDQELDGEPRITTAETKYLLEGLRYGFPRLDLQWQDILSTWAGVRPVVAEGNGKTPSQESRDHHLVDHDGLITVTGGKLTTFRLMALEALETASPYVGRKPSVNGAPLFFPTELEGQLPASVTRRLAGRYGPAARELLAASEPADLETIPGTRTLWAELRWGCREQVQHLDDLLLRRVRVGLLLAGGGTDFEGRIRALCQNALGWNDQRWETEWADYRRLWQRAYSVPSET